MESAVTAPVSGHVKRVVVHEGDTIANNIKDIANHAFTLRGFDQPGRFDSGNCSLIGTTISTSSYSQEEVSYVELYKYCLFPLSEIHISCCLRPLHWRHHLQILCPIGCRQQELNQDNPRQDSWMTCTLSTCPQQ
jgi:hypothetical protein